MNKLTFFFFVIQCLYRDFYLKKIINMWLTAPSGVTLVN
jgi:hypothetical protein